MARSLLFPAGSGAGGCRRDKGGGLVTRQPGFESSELYDLWSLGQARSRDAGSW